MPKILKKDDMTTKSLKMADDDEIDILGEFSFDSCLAQNNQGIPSCSSREDTVHPQWLLDSTETNNWYDKQSKDPLQSLRHYGGPSRKLLGDHSLRKYKSQPHTVWSQAERDTLAKEMNKYGRNIRKISQTLKSKSEIEIQSLIDAEFGVHLEPSSFGLDSFVEHTDIPAVVQEEIVTDDNHIKKFVVLSSITKHPFRKKNYNTKSQNSLLISNNKTQLLDSSEIFYDEEMTIGSTESVGSELDMTELVSKNIAKHQTKVKAEKKIGNHRRKVSRNYDKGPRSKDLMKSPQGRQRKDSSLSDDSVKSPKMQIVLGSGQALPVSEGEQVIKIEKKKDSEPESDIEIDVDSDNEPTVRKSQAKSEAKPVEEPIAVPLKKFEPMPRRQKKINLDGGGGYTIMHTEAGDLVQVGSEPRREKTPKNQPIHLIRCRVYNADKPAPYSVHLHVSTLILMDVHAHTSRGEVMGLTGGSGEALLYPPGHAPPPWSPGGQSDAPTLTVSAYKRAAAAADSTHCDMDPVSQSIAAQKLSSLGLAVVGWHHSHPQFPCAPSALDLASQRVLQRAGGRLAFITSQHWPPGRTASQYKCFRVEDDENGSETPIGYQFSVKLIPDITVEKLPSFLEELRLVLRDDNGEDALRVDLINNICPQARITYLEKCISSISHHMRSAGYSDDHPLVARLIQGFRDVLR